MIYLYAIAEGIATIDDLPGAGGEQLLLITVDGLTVVASELPHLLPVEKDTLVAQDRTIRALHARAAALLPMRFGSAFSSRADVDRAIGLQCARLRDALTLVRHREQMTLHVMGARAAAAPSPKSSGSEYLKARATPPEIAPLLEAIKPVQRATLVERGRAAGMIATVFQLIDRGRSGEYRHLVSATAETMPGISVHVSGPAPCFAFT